MPTYAVIALIVAAALALAGVVALIALILMDDPDSN